MRKYLVTGGAGFVGSHLSNKLLRDGHCVTVIDSLITGDRDRLSAIEQHPGFAFIEADISSAPLPRDKYDGIFHLASIASPAWYERHPIETLEAGSVGTMRLLTLAAATGAKLVMTSTSEVYGDPAVTPQIESYWGNVNPVGPRSAYDESKRFAEAAVMAYVRQQNVDATILRLFNTYGPGMAVEDGRLVPEFMKAATLGLPLPIFGTGLQTRSMCFVEDTVEAIVRGMGSSVTGPINVGTQDERSVLQIAAAVSRALGRKHHVVHLEAKEDEPQRRRPDITLAQQVLKWSPTTSLERGLDRTVAWYQRHASIGVLGERAVS